MPDLPADWSALCVVVLLLGMRHGLDGDHVAAIDGMTRLAVRGRARHSRWCGLLFSLGHGTVVLAIAAVIGASSARWTAPGWLHAAGGWISIAFLLAIGVANLRGVMAARRGHPAPAGLAARLLGASPRPRGVIGSAAVGALFALSFDTVSQAALFGVTAARFGGLGPALTLGLLFAGGMAATDGVTGWAMSRLLARTDRLAAVASQVMGVAVGAVGLLVAAVGIARLASPLLDALGDGRELAVGAGVLLVMAASWLLAEWLARRDGVAQAAATSRCSIQTFSATTTAAAAHSAQAIGRLKA